MSVKKQYCAFMLAGQKVAHKIKKKFAVRKNLPIFAVPYKYGEVLLITFFAARARRSPTLISPKRNEKSLKFILVRVQGKRLTSTAVTLK